MGIKRILTSIIGIPLVIILIALGNKQIIGITILITSLMCMYEYFGVVKKVAKPIEWVGYISHLLIILPIFIDNKILINLIGTFFIPILMLILFLHIILTNMKITFKDVSYTFIGIMYIPFFLMFLVLTRCALNQIILGLGIVISWSTDIFAYLVGKNFGKHKYSKISPNKTVEGCIAGAIGAIVISSIYYYIISIFTKTEYSVLNIAIISLVLSTISQIGDFVASSIKRFADTKDYGTLLPGHGGMLDRLDSLIFIAPFLYLVGTYFIN